ncbi:hypothetical protein MOUN0_L05270 [Monosporozyma unispora]
MTNCWKELVEKKRNQLYNKIPAGWRLDEETINRIKNDSTNVAANIDKLCPKEENDITNTTLLELKDKIANKKVSCYEVAYAFCHRAALIHQVVNCLTEILFDEALETAKRYDLDTPDVLPPLYGIPISLKDQCNVENVDTTLGYLNRAFKPKSKQDESLIVTLLRDAGAILYVKTTVPPSMMATETVSNLFGYTYNTINTNFSTGGSSGGEGALIGARGSVLGLGTDIGGSIRIPSSYHGLVGLRPSTGTVPYLRVDNSWEGREVISSVIGPMSRDIKDLRYFMDLMANDFKPHLEDVKCSPFYFDAKNDRFTNDYVVGIQYGDGVITPTPTDLQALKLCEDTINSIPGFRAIKWSPPTELNDEMYSLAWETDLADAGKEIKSEFDATGEPLCEILEPMVLDDSRKQYTVNQWWDLSRRINDAKQRYRDYYNSFETKDRPSVIICPSTLHPFKPGNMLKATVRYILFVNLLNFPSLSLPITSFKSEIHKIKQDTCTALNHEDEIEMEYWNELINDDQMEGFPISLQIMSPTFDNNEVCKFGAFLLEKLSSHK